MADVNILLIQQFEIAEKAAEVLQDSIESVTPLFKKEKTPSLTKQDKEACEALNARFSRLCDFLIQKLFRTIDEAELIFEGSLIDRLNRMEKRGIIHSAEIWKELRLLRNDIAHEYLMDQAKTTLLDALKNAPTLIQTVTLAKKYCTTKQLI